MHSHPSILNLQPTSPMRSVHSHFTPAPTPRDGAPTQQHDTPANTTTTAAPRAVVTVSSLYSTAQCILSMVGSIGVILLFAGIPQLIYSPSVQLSNLMTFLLGASLITAMVGGNAFVNYKYRQYLHSRNQVSALSSYHSIPQIMLCLFCQVCNNILFLCIFWLSYSLRGKCHYHAGSINIIIRIMKNIIHINRTK